jgi:hypothetical protein
MRQQQKFVTSQNIYKKMSPTSLLLKVLSFEEFLIYSIYLKNAIVMIMYSKEKYFIN